MVGAVGRDAAPTHCMTIQLHAVKPLHSDEPAWGLFEKDVLVDGKTLRRTQTVRVIRDDRLVDFTIDLGPSYKYKVEPFFIPSYKCLTVGQVLEYAERIRLDGTGLQTAMDDYREEFDLRKAYIDQTEQRNKYIKQNWRTLGVGKKRMTA